MIIQLPFPAGGAGQLLKYLSNVSFFPISTTIFKSIPCIISEWIGVSGFDMYEKTVFDFYDSACWLVSFLLLSFS